MLEKSGCFKPIRRWVQVAPDCSGPGDLGNRGRKTLDDRRPGVVHGLQTIEHRAEWDMASAWYAPVVLTQMHVVESGPERLKRRGNVLLLNIRVKGVKEDADRGMPDFAVQALRVRGRIQEVRFEAV